LDQKADILMKYFRENKSQRAIARELGISRTTVQKYIKDFKTKHEKLMELKQDKDGNKIKILALIEEMASKPKYDTSSRTRVKLTEEIINEIDKLIAKNEKNKLLGRHKQLMKKIDIHEYLVEKGYDIGYTTVCNYIRENYEKKEAYIRQQYDLGETLEFDWGDVKLTIAGKATTLNMGLFTTAKGPYHYARLEKTSQKLPLKGQQHKTPHHQFCVTFQGQFLSNLFLKWHKIGFIHTITKGHTLELIWPEKLLLKL